MLAKLPLPTIEQLTIKWIIFLFFGIMVGFQLREVVVKANPGNVLVGLDWGILFGAVIYYVIRLLG
jgi:hypothetical protein